MRKKLHKKRRASSLIYHSKSRKQMLLSNIAVHDGVEMLKTLKELEMWIICYFYVSCVSSKTFCDLGIFVYCLIFKFESNRTKNHFNLKSCKRSQKWTDRNRKLRTKTYFERLELRFDQIREGNCVDIRHQGKHHQ